MKTKQITPEELLSRAYHLKSEAEMKALYHDWAITYDGTMMEELRYLTPQRVSAMLADVASVKDTKVLDVGCGTGLAGEFLSKYGFEYIDGLDFSLAMLEVARQREKNGKRVYSNVFLADLNQKLELKDNIYDALCCTGTFTHAHVGGDCLDELVRILKPGGKFACTVHKDVWKEGGFEDNSKRLEQAGFLQTISRQMDIYFETDDEPQGWYIVWEKIK